MTKLREQYLCSALDKFKSMISNGECSKADISYFCNLAKYELDRRGTGIDKKEWFTKKEVAKELSVSTSTIDRMIMRRLLPKGKKILHQTSLVWKADEVEQLKRLMFPKSNT